MKKIGIIIARFQVPTLHVGHTHLIDEVAKKSDKIIIFLGYRINQPDIKNPFPLSVREAMLKAELSKINLSHKVTIDHIEDHPESNTLWSSELDKKIALHKKSYTDASGESTTITLYGSRDSFIRHYMGIHKTSVIKEIPSISGKRARSELLLMKEDKLTDAHREGILYGLKYMYPVGMSVVDIVVYRQSKGKLFILLGRKKRETAYRIIGGFFDVNKDSSLEEAALRELREEVLGITVGEPRYVASAKIDDWRYRDNQHKIVSSLFVAPYNKGKPIPNDDIAEVKWVEKNTLNEIPIIESHKPFIKRALDYLE